MLPHMATLAIPLYSSASTQYQTKFTAIFDGSKQVPGLRVFPLDIDGDKVGQVAILGIYDRFEGRKPPGKMIEALVNCVPIYLH